jgi:CubicO group peptidase (beta-lactamase class C family)
MQLRDRKLLTLEDPIVNYIPELHQVYNPYGSMNDITIKHLMSHSSGFRASTWPWGGDKDWHPYEPLQWEQLTAMFPYTQILFKPGSQYSYSNPAIIFLGRVIELISGDDYEVYIDKNILKPLDMYHTYFDITPYHLLKNRSNSYYIENNLIKANGFDFDTGITVSNGGLNAPLEDMIKYLAWLSSNSAQKTEILSHDSLEEMWKSQHIVQKNKNYTKLMGLSFFIYDYQDIILIGHTGEQRGYISFIIFHPNTSTGAIAVFNTADIVDRGISETKHFSSQLQNKICQSIFPLFSNERQP